MDITDISIPGGRAEHGAYVIALGFFDGVHSGHREILSLTVREARAIGAVPAVFTFRDASGFKTNAPRLMREEDRFAAFAEMGIERVFVADFASLSDLSPEQFVNDILIGKCRIKGAVCGFNFRFGKDAVASSQDLSTLLLRSRRFTRVLRPVYYENRPISSSSIRAALEAGKIEEANEMLGRNFTYVAPVIEGEKLGRTLGIPTINQRIADGMVELRHGVYACECELGRVKYAAVANVGVRPTVDEAQKGGVLCETHIIQFSGELYGETVRVAFLRRLRDERKFQSLDELSRQIERDIAEVKKEYV